MRIGLDLDNVILDTDKYLLEEMLKEDKNKRNSGIINQNADYILSGMFDWSKDEIDSFLTNNMEHVASISKTFDNVKEYIDLLLSEGYEIYIITNRSSKQYKDPYGTTIKSLKDNEINYTKLIVTETNNKVEECINNKIDIMFDDRYSNCKYLLANNINCCLVKTRYEKRIFNDIETVSNFKDIYNKIHNI